MSLATWLVTLYPRAWRRRYEEEMLAVLDQHHVTLLTVLDLLFGMIRARLDPQYRDDSGLVLFTSLPRATGMAFAAWGAFVVCVDVMSGPLYLGMAFLLTGHREMYLPAVGARWQHYRPPVVAGGAPRRVALHGSSGHDIRPYAECSCLDT